MSLLSAWEACNDALLDVYRLAAREKEQPKGTRVPHGTRNGQPDSTGGYALKSRQM